MHIITYPHPKLRKQCQLVTLFDSTLKKQADQMYQLMMSNNGIGIAASQVAVLKRLTVVNVGEGRFNFVNPEIISFSNQQELAREGCLSIPDVYVEVLRSQSITLKAYDLKGELFHVSASDLFARVIQHEIDHLNGILFIDHLDQKVKEKLKNKLDRLQKEC